MKSTVLARMVSVGVFSGMAVCMLPVSAESVYPTVAAGDTVVLTSTRTESTVTVKGTLEVAVNGVGARAAETTVALGSPKGEPGALIKVSGGKFGNSNTNGGKNPTTLTLGADGGSGRLLVQSGELGLGKLHLSGNAAGDGNGFIDFLRIEGGKTYIRRYFNENVNTARVTIAGRSYTYASAHVQGPTVFNGTGAFAVESEAGAPIVFSGSNTKVTLNAPDTPVVFTGDADCTFNVADYNFTFSRGCRFLNKGAVAFSNNKSGYAFKFNGSDIIGADITNLYLKGSARLCLNGADVVATVRDLTGESSLSLVYGTGRLIADASRRDIAVNAPFGGSVTVRKTGPNTLTLGALATCVPTLEIAAGRVSTTGRTSITNFIAAAGTRLTVDGGMLTFEGGTFEFAGEALTTANGGIVVLKTVSSAPPALGDGLVLTVNDYWVDGARQAIGDHVVGNGTIRVVGTSYPYVSYGETVVLSESAAATRPVVQGHLIVTGGASAATKGTSVRLGSPKDFGDRVFEPAVIEIRGGTYGAAHSANSIALSIGADGGRGRLVAKAGELRFSSVSISASAAPDASGYIDYGRIEGGVLRLRSTANNATATGRVVFAAASGALAGEHAWGATTYSKGAFVVESLPGARISYGYSNQHATFNAENVSVRLTGEGDMIFSQDSNDADNNIKFNAGCSFEAAGLLRFSGYGRVHFAAGGLVGPDVTGVHLTGGAFLSLAAGTTNAVRGVTADGKSYIMNTSGVLMLDTSGGDADFDVAVRGTALTVLKKGAGAVTFGANTTNVPNFKAPDGGAIRIRGALTTSSAEIGGTCDLVVDGGRWTVGPGFVMAGGTVSKTNGGSIVVCATSTSAPVFPAGMALAVNEFYLDGVRQAEGAYALGGATLNVKTYDETRLTVWTNESETRQTYDFPSGSRYLGFLLKTPPASLTFSGGDVTLGSAGISVTDAADAAPTYDFGLPVNVATSQQWRFGPASATFRGPISLPSDAVGMPELQISSDADLVFAGTNSTFCGNLVVTGRNIRISGVNALGSGVNGAKVTLRCYRSKQTSNRCRVEDAVIDQAVNFAVPQAGENVYCLLFDGAGKTNILNGFATLPQWTEFGKNSTTIFKKGCSFREYTRQLYKGNATVIVRDTLSLGGSWGSRCTHPASEGGYLTNRLLLDCAVAYEGTSAGFAFLLAGQVHCLRDKCFTKGWIDGRDANSVNAQFHLNGHPQRLERLTGNGFVLSTNAPAVVELAYASGTCYTNTMVFAGQAGVRKAGLGTAVFQSAATTKGTVSVESGVLELNNTWHKASEVAVSGTGTLRLGAGGRVFGPQVVMRLSEEGALELPADRVQRVAELYLDGSDTPVRAGLYTAANTRGRVRSGTVLVAGAGMCVIVR